MFVRGISFEKRNDGRVKTSSIYRQVSSGRPQKRIQFDLKQIEEKEKQHLSICEYYKTTQQHFWKSNSKHPTWKCLQMQSLCDCVSSINGKKNNPSETKFE